MANAMMEEAEVERHEGKRLWMETVGNTEKLKQVKPGSVDGLSVLRMKLTEAAS